MYIRKCDICKNIIKDKKFLGVNPEGGSFNIFEICLKCAQPVMEFLKSKKLIENEKENKK